MKHLKKKITKIIDELIIYLFSIGGTDINVRVNEQKERYLIHITSNYDNMEQDKLNKLIKYLECPRQEEMEEYYWGLTGDSDTDTELTLVGMMTDQVEVDIRENDLELVLYRNKD